MECEAEITKNEQNNANAGSDTGSFAMGLLEAMMEDWACEPLK